MNKVENPSKATLHLSRSPLEEKFNHIHNVVCEFYEEDMHMKILWFTSGIMLMWAGRSFRVPSSNARRLMRFHGSEIAKFVQKNSQKFDPTPINDDWVSLNLGRVDGKKIDSAMDDRLQDTERWVSRTLSEEEAASLHRSLGLEEFFDDDDEDDGEVNEKKKQKKVSKSRSIEKMSKFEILKAANRDIREAAQVKGFLEMNPYICSGCGTPFQSKNATDPGFLPSEKLQEHRIRAEKIKEKQNAIKILEMAGIEVDSEAANEILRDANVPLDVIAGVRALGKGQRAMDDKEKSFRLGASNVYKKAGTETHGREYQIDFDVQSSPQKFVNAEASTQVDTDVDTINADNLINDINEEVNNRHMFPRRLSNKRPELEENIVSQQRRDTLEKTDSDAGADLDTVCICQRCYRLQQYGQVEQNLRPGWSSHDLLTPERFETLLSTIKDSPAVVLCIVDVFDLKGSLLANLKQIAGANPIVIAANKADLLPKDASQVRITNWIHTEAKNHCGLQSPREAENERRRSPAPSYAANRLRQQQEDSGAEAGVLRLANVHLVSCQGGMGMDKLIASLMSMAVDHGNKVYVMGAANVGKSSFINRLLQNSYHGGRGSSKATTSKKSNVPKATVSNLPGTTLDFLKIHLPNGVTMIDTPGLLNTGQLTARLTTDELRQVIPAKPINAVTLRVSEGKCVLIGGLANVELSQVHYNTLQVRN